MIHFTFQLGCEHLKINRPSIRIENSVMRKIMNLQGEMGSVEFRRIIKLLKDNNSKDLDLVFHDKNRPSPTLNFSGPGCNSHPNLRNPTLDSYLWIITPEYWPYRMDFMDRTIRGWFSTHIQDGGEKDAGYGGDRPPRRVI